MQPMNILLTGAFGFIGINLSKHLKSELNSKLIAVDLNKSNHWPYDVFHTWNKLDKANWRDLDAIIHLAGKAHDIKANSKIEDFFEINLGLTKIIFDRFLKSNAHKFLYFSSIKAVADQFVGKALTEAEKPSPGTPYGKSKLAAENYIQSAFEHYKKSNNANDQEIRKMIYILRPCMIHGPGNKGNLNLLYHFVKRGIPYPLGAFDNQRSFLSIKNLNFVIQSILTRQVPSGIYHIADDEALSTCQLIRSMAASLKRKPRIWNISPFLIERGVRIGDVLRLPLNSERLSKLTESYIVSNKRIKNALGILRMPLTALQGLEHTLRSFH